MAEEKDRTVNFAEEQKIMAAYIDTAKTYTQLSLGALVLSITFFEKVLGYVTRIPVVPFLLAAWIFWLLGAVAGASYQYFAVRYLEARGEDWGLLERGGHPQPLKSLAKRPWIFYAILLACFYLGSICFAIVGALQLLGRH